jgi:hypothetical protein
MIGPADIKRTADGVLALAPELEQQFSRSALAHLAATYVLVITDGDLDLARAYVAGFLRDYGGVLNVGPR